MINEIKALEMINYSIEISFNYVSNYCSSKSKPDDDKIFNIFKEFFDIIDLDYDLTKLNEKKIVILFHVTFKKMHQNNNFITDNQKNNYYDLFREHKTPTIDEEEINNISLIIIQKTKVLKSIA